MDYLKDMDYNDDYYPLDIDDDSFYDMSYEEFEEEFITDPFSSYTLRNLWEDCLTPTCSDGFSAIFHILMSCLLFRFTCSFDFLPSSVLHAACGASGLYCLHHMFGMHFLYVLALAFIGYSSLLLMHKICGRYRGVTCTIICFLFLIVGELTVEPTVWHKIRGSQMVLGMKLMSLAFDIDSENQLCPSFCECFGYLFSVGNVIFGPWVSFATYLRILHHRSESLQWAVKVIHSLLLGFGFLTVSTCWTSWFLQSTSWKWIGAYRDALSFRSSHYFVSYISEALIVASGISLASTEWSLPVVHPYNIEVPRSLVEVVICWNLPMHTWLKKYVYTTAQPLGSFMAIFLTFAASSLLHGLNFQLAAVLLSLGCYTYVEGILRKKLANAFSACILARRCKRECDHEFKKDHHYVIAINLAFGFLAVFHLAYLGVMFDSTSENQEKGYSMTHTLGKWSELNYTSHWVAFVTYLFYLTLS